MWPSLVCGHYVVTSLQNSNWPQMRSLNGSGARTDLDADLWSSLHVTGIYLGSKYVTPRSVLVSTVKYRVFHSDFVAEPGRAA